MIAANHFLPLQTELGECPLWDHRTNTLYLVDIIRCRLIGYDWMQQKTTEWPLPALGGGLALASNGRLVVATQRGVFLFDPAAGTYEFLLQPEPDRPFNRLNEGKCDAKGRFWIGSMCTIDRRASGSLYRIDPSGAFTEALTDIIIPNTLTWTPDGGSMIFADSWRKLIWRFSCDGVTGALSNRQVFVDCTNRNGIPDGVAGDREGSCWVAQFGDGRIIRYGADGNVISELELPVTQITSCVFAGPDLDHLVIVSTKRTLNEQQRREQPLAGDLFLAKPGVHGMTSPIFGN